MLPVIWSVFAVCAVGGFLMLAAYWLDVQDRPDLTFRRRVVWSAGTFLFPLTWLVVLGSLVGNATVDDGSGVRVMQFVTPTAAAMGVTYAIGSFAGIHLG